MTTTTLERIEAAAMAAFRRFPAGSRRAELAMSMSTAIQAVLWEEAGRPSLL